jgi:hypothetical protein
MSSVSELLWPPLQSLQVELTDPQSRSKALAQWVSGCDHGCRSSSELQVMMNGLKHAYRIAIIQ